ncbi:hypothetical protein QJS10_CPA01g01950 [Acorus calamus]|uniref:Uncharacterized protein n=1 Tax=Acorus calamus TaxID=4465 RepID=A0AAV9FJR0_ACOCL|nr:hypothetical protein QJS10_CPA01g01950 [Acorus calamus]
MDVDGPVFQGEDLTWTQVEHEAYGDTVEHQRPRRSTQQTHQSQGARRRGKRPIIEEPEDEDDDDDEEDEIIPATQFQGQEGVGSSDETRDADNEIQEENTDSDDNNGGHGGNDGGDTSYGYGTPLGGTQGGDFVNNAMDYLFK